MLTRSFLFLLAMLTGFSAAQAADNRRHTPTATSAAAAVLHNAAASRVDEVQAPKGHIVALQSAGFDLVVFTGQRVPLPQLAIAPRIYIGDRNRQ